MEAIDTEASATRSRQTSQTLSVQNSAKPLRTIAFGIKRRESESLSPETAPNKSLRSIITFSPRPKTPIVYLPSQQVEVPGRGTSSLHVFTLPCICRLSRCFSSLLPCHCSNLSIMCLYLRRFRTGSEACVKREGGWVGV